MIRFFAWGSFLFKIIKIHHISDWLCKHDYSIKSTKFISTDLEQFSDGFLCQGTNPGWNVVLVLLDPGVGVLQGLGLERGLAHQQRVQDAADRPVLSKAKKVS